MLLGCLYGSFVVLRIWFLIKCDMKIWFIKRKLKRLDRPTCAYPKGNGMLNAMEWRLAGSWAKFKKTNNESIMKKLIIPSFALFLILISCKKEQVYEFPLVYTGDVTNMTDTSALFTAKISCLGDYPILESGFIWGVHSNDNNGIKIKNNEDVNDIYSLNTNEKLLPGKTFYVRAYVQTEFTTSYGNEVSFKSPPGQVETGKWSRFYDDNLGFGWCEYIKFSFTLNNITYFVIDGDLYSYIAETNTFKYEYTDQLIAKALFSVVYNKNVYLFCGDTFYIFSPQSKSFTKLSVFDVNNAIYWGPHFLIDDNIYLGIGTSEYEGYTKDFWKYNITTDSWQQIEAFPGEYRSNPFSFGINNCGYIGGGFNLIQGQWPYPKFSDLWCYYPITNKWIQKESLPFKNEELYDLVGANTEGFGYCFYQNIFYEYNPVFDIWEKMADLNDNFCYPYIFTIGSKVFVLGATSYMDTKYFKMWGYEK